MTENRITRKDAQNFNKLVIKINLLCGNSSRIITENMEVLASILETLPDDFEKEYEIFKQFYNFDNKLLLYIGQCKKFIYTIVQCYYISIRRENDMECIIHDVPTSIICDLDELKYELDNMLLKHNHLLIVLNILFI